MDGADTNRQFIKLHFKGRDPVADKFITPNIHTRIAMVFIMDPKVIYIFCFSLPSYVTHGKMKGNRSYTGFSINPCNKSSKARKFFYWHETQTKIMTK